MRLFQNSGFYPGYLPRLNALSRSCETYRERLQVFLKDRYSACHILQPVLRGDATAMFTNGDDQQLQRMWARENGLAHGASSETILLSQIENHRTEVFYNIDPIRFGDAFLARLPGCVKVRIAWRAVPSGNVTLSAYDRVVCNFPEILRGYAATGHRTAYFTPAHDAAMDTFALSTVRPVDILFVGGYSRHHRRRASVLEAVASLRHQAKIVFHLDRSRLTRIAESPLGRLFPMARHRRPPAIRDVSADAVYGTDLYSAISRAKIVLNGAIDASGDDRGNMRCWEALGCGALMLSDEGKYPPGLLPGRDFETYRDADDAVRKMECLLADQQKCRKMATDGHSTISTAFSKASQWSAFETIVAQV